MSAGEAQEQIVAELIVRTTNRVTGEVKEIHVHEFALEKPEQMKFDMETIWPENVLDGTYFILNPEADKLLAPKPEKELMTLHIEKVRLIPQEPDGNLYTIKIEEGDK